MKAREDFAEGWRSGSGMGGNQGCVPFDRGKVFAGWCKVLRIAGVLRCFIRRC
jgi:hypothetical protein